MICFWFFFFFLIQVFFYPNRTALIIFNTITDYEQTNSAFADLTSLKFLCEEPVQTLLFVAFLSVMNRYNKYI